MTADQRTSIESTPAVAALYRYPVKGFSAESLERADVEAGGTFPFDRAYAVENAPSGFDPAAPAHLPKIRFLVLMRHERLAEYSTRFDEHTGLFQAFRHGRLAVEGSLQTEAGRSTIEVWLAETFKTELRGPPKILFAPNHSFSDRAAKVMHLVNLASIRALEEHAGQRVDPLRFRPNIVIDHAPAWSERDWEGLTLRLPNLDVKVDCRTTRCAATNVDPQTARRDMEIPRLLESLHDEADFGVYVVAATSGTIALGDRTRY